MSRLPYLTTPTENKTRTEKGNTAVETFGKSCFGTETITAAKKRISLRGFFYAQFICSVSGFQLNFLLKFWCREEGSEGRGRRAGFTYDLHTMERTSLFQNQLSSRPLRRHHCKPEAMASMSSLGTLKQQVSLFLTCFLTSNWAW